mmetsp:Transcript_98/g.87  ORF Transcript_98/g.87 Transcript_98/m.87 type:complete len:167 (+) Transcript_98:249-749(+)
MSHLSKLMRRSVFNARLPARSGPHDFPRPDPPIPHAYQHKRVLSIFDTNMWWYDTVAPEYLFTYTCPWMGTGWDMFSHMVLYMLVCGIPLWIAIGFNMAREPKHGTLNPGNVPDGYDPYFDWAKYMLTKPYAVKDIMGRKQNYGEDFVSIKLENHAWNSYFAAARK